ncbi:MAG: hypothetical protein JRJ47_02050 [Deltaproteobacteria bacterium]|nr:hypothetical protein [Deltaproteobacteria bacterium]
MTVYSRRDITNKALSGALLIVLLTLLFLVSYRPIFSNDIWLHLKVGELIAKSPFDLPETDSLTYTSLGRPWVLHEWLSQLLFFQVYDYAGFTGLRFFRSVVETLTLALFFFGTYRLTRRPIMSLAILLVIAYLLRTRVHIRPEIFSHLFISLFFLAYFTMSEYKSWLLFPVFLGLVLWANMHSFMVLVIVILLVGLISRGLVSTWPFRQAFAKPSGSKFKAAMLSMATLAVFVTPHASKTLDYVLSGSQVARDYIMEWQPIFISLQRGPYATLRGAIAFPFLLKVLVLSVISLFLIGLLLSLLWKKSPRWPLDHALIGLAMTILALSAARFVWLLTIPLVLTAHYFAMAIATSDEASRRSVVPELIVWLLFWAGVFFWVGTARTTIPLNMHQTVEKDRYPASIADIMKEVSLKGRMFNPYGWGGYLLFYLYPDYQVFVDGRTVLHGAPLLRDHFAILHGNPGYQKLIDDKYQFDFIMLPKEYGMMNTLPNDSWILLFENYNSSLYLRRNQDNRSNLHRFADYCTVNRVPFDIEEGFDVSTTIRNNPEWAHRYGLHGGSTF